MGEVLVRAEGVGKKFCRDLRKSLWYGLKDLGAELFAASGGERRACLRSDEFWAVDDVSFELRRGECLGLIGRNGAGKTTLLKMLNGLIKPDRGRIEVRGRVGALIALGAGFSPVLTGRENIYVSGAVLGMRKREIDRRLEEIVEFAELGEFIDAPVQSYSSGMTVRLGFAVASTLSPDVLILDEVLAVGDAGFRHKCYRRVQSLVQSAAVVLVTHDMDHVAQIATSVMTLRGGRSTIWGSVREGIAAYMGESSELPPAHDAARSAIAFYPPIVRATVSVPTPTVRYGESLTVTVQIQSEESIEPFVLSISATDWTGRLCMCWHSTRHNGSLRIDPGTTSVEITIDPLLLHDGVYQLNVFGSRIGAIEHLVWMFNAANFSVISDFRPLGSIPYLPFASVRWVSASRQETHCREMPDAK